MTTKLDWRLDRGGIDVRWKADGYMVLPSFGRLYVVFQLWHDGRFVDTFTSLKGAMAMARRHAAKRARLAASKAGAK